MSTQKRKENKRSRRGKRLVLPYVIAIAVIVQYYVTIFISFFGYLLNGGTLFKPCQGVFNWE